MEIFCRTCNRSNQPGAISCSNCGKRLLDENVNAVAVEPSTEQQHAAAAPIFGDVQTSTSQWELRGRKLVLGVLIGGVLFTLLSLAVGFAFFHFYAQKTPDQVAVASPVFLLWDFTTPHDNGKEPLVPVDIRREINAAVVRQDLSSDEVSIFSFAEGTFTEGGTKQQVYTTWQFGRSVIEHISYFALYTDGKLTLIPNPSAGTVLRTVRLPGADVDYLVLDTNGGNLGESLDYIRVVSLRDGELSKVIADVGITNDNFCGSEAPGAHWVASKVFYRPAGTAMEIMPFEQYVQGCNPNDKFTFLKITKDDASKM